MQLIAMLKVVPKDNSSTQRTDFGLRAVKIDGRAGSHAGAKISPECMTHGYVNGHHCNKWLARSEQTSV